jgi:crotonobetainyl-CoA:carnitine CoA-transferase CaiB-like acyl-CoA transferase
VVTIDPARRLATALGLEVMADDPRFATNIERVRHRAELEAALADAIVRHEREPLLALLEQHGVPATPVNTVDQVMKDPQTLARGIIEQVTHPTLGPIPIVGMPLRFSRIRPEVRRAAPLRAEHTDEVLSEVGYSSADIATLREKKVIA